MCFPYPFSFKVCAFALQAKRRRKTMSKVSKLKKLGIMLIVSGMLMSMLTACGGSKTAAADDTKDNNTTAQTDAQDQTDPDEN